MMLATGVGGALPAIWALQRVVEAQLFGVNAIDVPTIALAVAGLSCVVVAAAMLPAWRASLVDPNLVLHAD